MRTRSSVGKHVWRFRIFRTGQANRWAKRTVAVQASSLAGARLGLGLYADEQASLLGGGFISRIGRLRPVSKLEMADFFQVLGSALRSGHSLGGALAMVARQCRSARMRGLVGDLIQLIQQGQSLSEAMEQMGPAFDASELALAKASSRMTLAETGALFFDLSTSLRRDAGLARRLAAALWYPFLVLGMACGAALILQQKALPPMVELFRSLGVELPVITRLFYFASCAFSRHWELVVVTSLLLVVCVSRLAWWWLRRGSTQRLLVMIPVIGPVVRARSLSRALAVFSLLKQSGASSRDMFEHAAEAAGNPVVREFFLRTYCHIRDGDVLEQAFMEERHLLGDDGVRLAGKMELGMSGQDLGVLISACVDDMSQQAELRLSLLPKFLEIPLLILCAVIIGTIMLAIFLPYPSLLADLAGRIRS